MEQKLTAIHAAGFDGVSAYITPEMKAGADRRGLQLVSSFDCGDLKTARVRLAEQRDLGVHFINIQLLNHDTPPTQAAALAVRLIRLSDQLGLGVHIETHRDTSTETPEKFTETKDVSKPIAIRTEVGYLKFGDLEVAVIPGEIYPELVLGKVQDPADPGADFPDAPVEPAIYAQLRGKHRMLIGLGNDEIGYLIPKRQWDEKPPFCYGRKKAQYGEENSVGPEAAPIICGSFRDLVKP